MVTEFIRHLIPPQEPPAPAALIPLLRLLNPEMQRLVAKFIIGTDRIRKQDAESLAPSSGSEPKSTGAIPESPQQ